eukprot:s2248_g21.t1
MTCSRQLKWTKFQQRPQGALDTDHFFCMGSFEGTTWNRKDKRVTKGSPMLSYVHFEDCKSKVRPTD